jgi:hypothetical protein
MRRQSALRQTHSAPTPLASKRPRSMYRQPVAAIAFSPMFPALRKVTDASHLGLGPAPALMVRLSGSYGDENRQPSGRSSALRVWQCTPRTNSKLAP